jgi:hypothetical protein
MSDQVQFQDQSGDLAGQQDNVANEQVNTTPAKVELSAEVVSRIAEETARAFRGLQSMQEKKAKAIAQDVVKQVTAAREIGAQISAEQEQGLIRKALDQYLESGEDAGNPADQQGKPLTKTQQPNGDPDSSYVERRVAALARKYGGLLLASDPESVMVEKYVDADDYLDKYQAALEKRAQRPPAAGRIPTMVRGNAPTTKEGMVEELARLAEHPNVANLARMKELKIKLQT